MSRFVKCFATVALIFSLIAFAPGSADARWGGGWHGGGWRGGGWGGWRGGGWGWGPAFVVGFAPAFAWGVGPGWGWGPGWGNPYWNAGARCGWVPVRV
jgi:hypothetical protein